MEEGFIPDMTYGGVRQLGWHAGSPARNWLTGVKVHNELMTVITAHRCTQCGFLKLYAKPTGE
jgi:hypothetical protein